VLRTGLKCPQNQQVESSLEQFFSVASTLRHR
jgi:hypothetical protein